MPVIATFKEILALCWRERATALTFGLVPLGVNLILAGFVTDVAPASVSAYAKNLMVSLISLLAFSPFCVTWYRMILFGKSDITSRSVVMFRRREWRFFGWTLAVTVATGPIGAIIAIVGAALVVGLVVVNPVLGAVVGAVAAVVYVAILLWALSRLSMTLALAAADQPASFNLAWTMAKPYGWSMVGIQLLIVLGLVVIAVIPLSGTIPDMVEAARAKTEPPASAQLTLQLVGTIAGAVFLWLTSTMYALVYRRIGAATPPLPSTGPDLSPTTPSQDHGATSMPSP
ncbi:MAG: hypothetical protein SFV19_02510 [Rhodospirillaceae bacterium]|nr:hypothetical protein [Rhodospirillaceae bacterium]